MTRALIRVDGGGWVGHGHLYRMLALCAELEARSCEVQCITRTVDILGRLPASAMLDTGPEYDQAERLVAMLRGGFDVLVVDLPELPGPLPDDAQIHVIPRSHPWPGLPAPLDWQHVILRRAFAAPHPMRADVPARPLCYVSGGGCGAAGLDDVLDQAARVLAIPALAPRGNATAEDIAAMMDRCSVAIVAYGMTALECASRGLPAVVVCPTALHEVSARQLAAAGACVNLGLERRPVTIGRAASNLVQNRRHWQAMAAAGPRLIDGRGASRVADAILEGLR